MATIQGRIIQDDLESFFPFINDEFRNHVVTGNVITITESNVPDPVRIELTFRDLTYRLDSDLSPIITGGTLIGIVYSVRNGLAWSELASIRDINLNAAELYAATMTRNNSLDDRQAIERMLIGDDEFILSSQNDIARGYAGNDNLRGAGGNDSLDGGQGFDIASFSGRFREYTIIETPGRQFDIRDTVGNRDGEDILTNIEILRFSDLVIPLEFLRASRALTGVITTTNQSHGNIVLNAPAVVSEAFDDLYRNRLSYQWFRDDVEITGATNSTHTANATGSGSYRVLITFTGGDGFASTLQSPSVNVATSSGNAAQPTYQYEVGVVYRLFNSGTGQHLFSSNRNEIDILTGEQRWINEGASYRLPTSGGQDVYRFLVLSENRHFYTASNNERDYIINSIAGYRYEGAAFTVYSPQSRPSNATAVSRFLNIETGRHIFSSSQVEMEILGRSSQWRNEGIAWYAE